MLYYWVRNYNIDVKSLLLCVYWVYFLLIHGDLQPFILSKNCSSSWIANLTNYFLCTVWITSQIIIIHWKFIVWVIFHSIRNSLLLYFYYFWFYHYFILLIRGDWRFLISLRNQSFAGECWIANMDLTNFLPTLLCKSHKREYVLNLALA